jgi:hypothetical protein
VSGTTIIPGGWNYIAIALLMNLPLVIFVTGSSRPFVDEFRRSPPAGANCRWGRFIEAERGSTESVAVA